jgi:hypothetical protein
MKTAFSPPPRNGWNVHQLRESIRDSTTNIKVGLSAPRNQQKKPRPNS